LKAFVATLPDHITKHISAAKAKGCVKFTDNLKKFMESGALDAKVATADDKA